jgi:hypothetical protein
MTGAGSIIVNPMRRQDCRPQALQSPCWFHRRLPDLLDELRVHCCEMNSVTYLSPSGKAEIRANKASCRQVLSLEGASS